MRKLACIALALFAATAFSQERFASETDVAKLEADLRNLEADLSGVSSESIPADVSQRIEAIQEEVIYLKVSMRKHREAGGAGTGVSLEEVRSLRLDIADARNDLRPLLSSSLASSGTITVPEGTEFAVRLEDSLSSRTAAPGDRFTAHAAAPIMQGNVVLVDAGTRFRGVVELVDRAEGKTDRTARLILAVNEIEYGGTTQSLSATVTDASERLQTGLGSEAKKIGIGAGLGTALGAVLGGKTGAIIGAAVGGGGAILATEGKEVELPHGTILHLRLDRDLALTPSPSES